MRPITDPDALPQGATLYHSAFGFARVVGLSDEGVQLAWEREGPHLPLTVSAENLRRVYALCAPGGFFHQAVTQPKALLHTLHHQPADALVRLLEDLGQAQRLPDVMDWFVGRQLFTPKTFVRWWGTAEGPLRADRRLCWEGELVSLRDDGEVEVPALTQLAPGVVAADEDIDLGPAEGPYAPDDIDELRPATATGEVALDTPTPLADLDLPASRWFAVGLAVAEALAASHAQQRLAMPTAESVILSPDGTVRLTPTEVPRGFTPAEDVRAAAILLIEAFTGRALPRGVVPQDTVPFLRHRLPDLAPSATAPLYTALAATPAHRPSAAAWATQWRHAQAAERDRMAHENVRCDLRAGYDTHIGRVKMMLSQVNQDALFVGQRGNDRIMVVADGISVANAGRGDIASWLAVQTVARLWEQADHAHTHARRLLERALQLANRAICERSLALADGRLAGRMPMGTTITVALARGNRIHLAWLGDSRAYVVGDYGVGLLTADDNVSGERFLQWCEGGSRAWSPHGHALVRYLGHFDDRWRPAPFAPRHATFVLRPGERLLLCSDGITDYLAEDECTTAALIARAVAVADVDEAARTLVAHANRRGGGDNATAIVIEGAAPEDDVAAW